MHGIVFPVYLVFSKLNIITKHDKQNNGFRPKSTFREKGISTIWTMIREKKAQVVFGVADPYETNIYNIQYIIRRYYYSLVYPIGMHIFPIGYSL